MTKNLIALLFLFMPPLSMFSKTILLQDALQKKWVTTTVSMQANEATGGRNLRIAVKNLTKSDVQILIPVGFVFQAKDSTVQDFIHLENKEMAVAAQATKSAFLLSQCIRATRRSPHNGDAFLATTLASSHLLALTTFAFDKKLHKQNAMQSALWAVSDNEDLVGISNADLLTFVARLLNKPLPDYTVDYRIRDEAGVTALAALEPLHIEGVFQYTLPTDQQVRLDLVDTAGVSVLKDFNMVETMTQTKGKHRFTFTLMLKGIPRGTYFVKMTAVSDGKEWASKQVVF